MIIDAIPALLEYFPEDLVRLLVPFILMFDENSSAKEYPLKDTGVIGRVQTYRTKPASECKVESHRKFADIQIMLNGSERIDVFAAHALKKQTDYNAENDVIFYEPPQQDFITLNMQPGFFALFYPQDAHRPQMQTNNEPAEVTKLVIKIPID